jgi:hypothetical protein
MLKLWAIISFKTSRMKKIVLVFLFFTLHFYSQNNFKFDFYTDYDSANSNNVNSKDNTLVFSSSSDQNVNLLIHNKSYGSGKLSAILLDSKYNLTHYFDIIANKEGSINAESFDYLFSVQFDRPNCDDRNVYEFIESSEKPDFNSKIVVYENKKKKKIEAICYLKKVISDKSYFTNFKTGVLGHFDRCKRLKIDNANFLVESAAFFNNDTGNIVRSIKLMNYGNIDINVSIKEIKYKTMLEMYTYLKSK